MNGSFEDVLAFAREWGIQLEVTYDETWAGHTVHRASVISQGPGKGENDRTLFWLTPENEHFCFWIPKDTTAEVLSQRYGLDIKALEWEDVREDVHAACLSAQEIDLENAVYRVFVQYLLNMRSEQLGFNMRKVVQAAIGGCIGR